MKKMILALPLAILLSSCATSGTGTPTSFIEQVRQAAVAACGFLPTVNTVAQIIATGNPIVVTASSIATAICAAVAQIPPQTARKGAAVPTVAGVVIHGKFIR